MSSLRAVRELRICGEATAEYLQRPVVIREDAVLDSILLRALIWGSPVDAIAASAVCKRWRLLTAAVDLWRIYLLRHDARLAAGLCGNDHNHAGLHDWRTLYRCACDRSGNSYFVRPPASVSGALTIRQLCEVEAACEEVAFVSNVAREHQAAKAFIPASVPASHSPLAEIMHWKSIATQLDCLHAEWSDESMVPRWLQQLESAEMGTAACEAAKAAVTQLKRLQTEAAWNVKYLAILEEPFRKLAVGSLRDLSVACPGLIRTLAMVWSSSKSYNSPARMEPLVYRCSRAFVARIASELHPIGLLLWACQHFATAAADDSSRSPPAPLDDLTALMPFLRTESLSLETATALQCALDAAMESAGNAELEAVVVQAALDAIESAAELLQGWRSSLLSQCGPEAVARFQRGGGLLLTHHKKLFVLPLAATGLSSSLGASTGPRARKRPPRHPSSVKLSRSLPGSSESSAAPSPIPTPISSGAATVAAASGAGHHNVFDDSYPVLPSRSPTNDAPSRAQLDEMRKSLRTPAFQYEEAPASARGGDKTGRRKANDWSGFDVDVHVALLDYACDRISEVRSLLLGIRDMSQQLREYVKSTDATHGAPVAFSADDSFVSSEMDAHSPIPSDAPVVLQYFSRSLLQLRKNLVAFQHHTRASDIQHLQLFDPAYRSLWNSALEHFRSRCSKLGFHDDESEAEDGAASPVGT